MRPLLIVLLAVVITPASLMAQRQAGTSAAPVKELATLLSARNQTAIAARDPESGAFVAALFYPGVQLLVVSAQSPAPEAVGAQLAAKNFQEVYSELQSPAAQPGRLFVQDMGVDGLTDGGDSVDVVYDEERQTLFDGNPRGHKLSDKAYRDRFSSADTRYAHILTVLLNEVKRARQL